MATAPILVDTGPLVALLSSSQQHHQVCRETLATVSTPLLTCWPVLTEAAYLLRRHPLNVRSLIASADGSFLRILPLRENDLEGITAILEKYEDQSFQLADAAVMYLAEREGIQHVFTLDRRDFITYRTTSGESLQIIPDARV